MPDPSPTPPTEAKILQQVAASDLPLTRSERDELLAEIRAIGAKLGDVPALVRKILDERDAAAASREPAEPAAADDDDDY